MQIIKSIILLISRRKINDINILGNEKIIELDKAYTKLFLWISDTLFCGSIYIGCPNIDGNQEVIIEHAKISRKYGIRFFHLTLFFEKIELEFPANTHALNYVVIKQITIQIIPYRFTSSNKAYNS